MRAGITQTQERCRYGLFVSGSRQASTGPGGLRTEYINVVVWARSKDDPLGEVARKPKTVQTMSMRDVVWAEEHLTQTECLAAPGWYTHHEKAVSLYQSGQVKPPNAD